MNFLRFKSSLVHVILNYQIDRNVNKLFQHKQMIIRKFSITESLKNFAQTRVEKSKGEIFLSNSQNYI